MKVKNIKSFIEFYKFLGVTNSMSQLPRNLGKALIKSKYKFDNKTDIGKKEISKKNKLDALLELKAEINKIDCSLKEIATNVVFSDGNYSSNIMIIGEAPGAKEDLEGKPFVGDAGQLLDKMLGFVNLSREKLYISNIVFWRPPGNRTPNESEISACLPITKKHIKIISPKLLIFVGNIASKSLLNTKEGITKLRGREHTYLDEEYNLEIPARTIFHPAYLLRNPIEKKKTWDDLIDIDEFIREHNLLS